jgi:hypothetical protein
MDDKAQDVSAECVRVNSRVGNSDSSMGKELWSETRCIFWSLAIF